MSARDLILPDSALAGTLSRQRRDVAGLERRTTWRSTIQEEFAYYDELGFAPIGDPSSGPGWEAASATLAATLELDPGRWTLVGSAVHEVYASPRYPNIKALGVIMNWSSGDLSGSSMTTNGEGDATHASWGPTISENSQTAASVLSDSPITVELFVFAGVEPPYTLVQYKLATASIIAFPS